VIFLIASALAASLAAAQTSPTCAPVDGIGCVYVPAKAAADGSAPLMIYFRGWSPPYNGAVPVAERLRTSRTAFSAYDLDRAADAAGAVLLVTGSSDAAVRDADIDALEKQVGRRFSRLILAAHSGGYDGLTASLPQKRTVARVIMLDDFYFDDGPDSLGHRVADLVAKGAACAGFYTPHNKDRYEQRFKPYLACAVEAYGPNDHEAKVKECLRGYATTGSCR
jgi:hypothetical protein